MKVYIREKSNVTIEHVSKKWELDLNIIPEKGDYIVLKNPEEKHGNTWKVITREFNCFTDEVFVELRVEDPFDITIWKNFTSWVSMNTIIFRLKTNKLFNCRIFKTSGY